MSTDNQCTENVAIVLVCTWAVFVVSYSLWTL